MLQLSVAPGSQAALLTSTAFALSTVQGQCDPASTRITLVKATNISIYLQLSRN